MICEMVAERRGGPGGGVLQSWGWMIGPGGAEGGSEDLQLGYLLALLECSSYYF